MLALDASVHMELEKVLTLAQLDTCGAKGNETSRGATRQ